MALIGNLIVKLKADTRAFNRSLRESAVVVSSLHGTLKGLSVILGSVGISFGSYITLKGINNATKAAIKYRDVVEDLAASLRDSRVATKDLLPEFKKYAEHLQDLTIYSDEAIIAEITHAKKMGITAARLKDVTKAAIGLAHKFRIDLNQAMTLIGEAARGNTRGLWEYGVMIDRTLSRVGKFNDVMKIGVKGFEDAKEAAKTTQGQIKQLTNELEQQKRKWGELWLPAKVELLRAAIGIVETPKLGVEVIKSLTGGYDSARARRSAMKATFGKDLSPAERKKLQDYSISVAGGVPVAAADINNMNEVIKQSPKVIGKFVDAARDMRRELTLLAGTATERDWFKFDLGEAGYNARQIQYLTDLHDKIKRLNDLKDKAKAASSGVGGRWTDIGGVWKGAASASLNKSAGTAVLEQIGRDQRRILEQIESNTDPDQNQGGGGGLR